MSITDSDKVTLLQTRCFTKHIWSEFYPLWDISWICCLFTPTIIILCNMCDQLFSIGLVLTGIEICFYIVSLFIVGGSLKNVIGTVIAVVCLVVEFLGIHDKRLDFINFSLGFRCIKFGFSIFLIIYIFEGNVPRYRSYGRNTMQVYCSVCSMWKSFKLCFTGLLFGLH